MILLKSILAGVAALFMAASATYGLSVQCGSLRLWRFSFFLEVFTGVSAAPLRHRQKVS
jgi:hypothetical protein